MTKGKTAGEDGITVDLIKEGGVIMLEKLAVLYTQMPQDFMRTRKLEERPNYTHP